MSGVKHTGWKADCGFHHHDPKMTCSVRITSGAIQVKTEDEARLIAAAPDLLEALIVARTAINQAYVDWDGEPEDVVPLQLARAKCDAAIARATGDRPEKGGAL